VVLIIEDDVRFARIMVQMAREGGFKAVVATRGDTGLALANELQPDAITLDIQLPVVDGWSVLDRLKRNPRTRHIPVHVISIVERNQRGASLGAFAHLEKPVSKERLEDAFQHIATYLDRQVKLLLLVEDNDTERHSVAELIGEGDDVEVTAVRSSEEALQALEQGQYDCMVVDLVLPELDGFRLIEQVKSQQRYSTLPIIVYTSKDLSHDEEQRLRKYAASVIVKSGVKSMERLLGDSARFLHRVEARMSVRQRDMIREARGPDASLAGKKILIIDDDMRNIFALTSVLEAHDVQVLHAESGRAGIDMLNAHPDVALVLMDVMMPDLDGYETTGMIRADSRFADLPIIAVTAKALKDDRDRCLSAGASDYLAKPVDPDRLMELVRLWVQA
jgi:CheY-like chemotaxis protein